MERPTGINLEFFAVAFSTFTHMHLLLEGALISVC